MNDIAKIKKEFAKNRDEILKNHALSIDAFKFSVSLSLLVEEYIFNVIGSKVKNFAVASLGSFSRRELSPFSDIDLMFITDSVESNKEIIQECVALLWDCGIEVSHTVREFQDITKFLEEDLHAFTQFFETRFLLGNEKIYEEFTKEVFSSLDKNNLERLVNEFFNDIKARYSKYGNSSKALEANVKYSCGGLRDFQAVGWIYSIKNKTMLNDQREITQAESFLESLAHQKIISAREYKNLFESYKLILTIRNLLHITARQKHDRLEFTSHPKVAKLLGYSGHGSTLSFMRSYFKASNIIHRFTKTMLRRYEEELTEHVVDILAMNLDDDFILAGKSLCLKRRFDLSFSDILRAFYYRCFYNAHFDENLRSLIIERVGDFEETKTDEYEPSAFFREILKMPKNVGNALFNLNELGVLKLAVPEFKELIGFFQEGVYHCYTADEHTLVAVHNTEKLLEKSNKLGRIFTAIKDKEILYLAILLHDIAKPVSLSGHEIVGAEIANSVMHRLGYSEDESKLVSFLVMNHLIMEQVAFRRNLNDADTLNSFVQRFSSIKELDLLCLLTYADLSAVNPAVWTEWKNDLLWELYSKAKSMLEEKISGEELLYASALSFTSGADSENGLEYQNHIESINDIGYMQHFSEEEIIQHIEEIGKDTALSVFFKEFRGYTNITIITKDHPALLSKLCGTLSINDLNIHDARIFTRKDGMVIDSFAVTDFRTHKPVDEERYEKIRHDLLSAVDGTIQLLQEFKKMRTKWWRIEKKFFKRTGKIKISFEELEKFTIVDVGSPDRLGLLYQITRKLTDLGLSIFFAKISTKGDDIIDSFYLLDRKNKKVSPNDYEMIRQELTETIEQML